MTDVAETLSVCTEVKLQRRLMKKVKQAITKVGQYDQHTNIQLTLCLSTQAQQKTGGLNTLNHTH